MKRPTFRYRYGDLTVEDFFEDRLDTNGTAFFRRTLKFIAPSAQKPFYFRAAGGKAISGSAQDWKIERLNVRLLGELTGTKREGEPAELLVPLELRAGETVIQLDYQW